MYEISMHKELMLQVRRYEGQRKNTFLALMLTHVFLVTGYDIILYMCLCWLCVLFSGCRISGSVSLIWI